MSKKRSIISVAAFLAVLFLSVGIFYYFSQIENQRFESYTNDFFCQEVSGNTITLHYTLKNPSVYGIDNIPISLGTVSTDTDAMCAYAENALARLRSYDRARLSDENQLTYDILEDTFTYACQEAKYALYEEPLAPLTGTQAQLPVLLSEYQFYSEADVNTYLSLLEEIPGYFQSILDFEKTKSKQGIFMASYSADDIIKECQAFIDMGDNNYLYSSFQERLKELNLDKSKNDNYIKKNSECIKKYVFPAYRTLKEGLSSLRTTGKNKNGLCYLPDGRSYYELLVKGETGSTRTISQLESLTKKQIAEDLAALQEVLSTLPEDLSADSDLFKTQGTMLEDSNPSSILTSLESKLGNSFPEPPKVKVQIKYVQKSMEDYLSPAFYMIPAIDNTNSNVIYINQGHISDDLSLFTTLAHEGYPGHLYQTVYYASLNPDPIRNLLNYGGYTEGWATYSEMMSYYYAPLQKEQATLMQKNSSILLGLYALTDMGIHYEGWTLLDTVSFFRSYGITDTDTIEEIYDLIIADPANYLKYYIGYVEFMELKKDAVKEWGKNFTQKRFHKEVLDIGPAPFNLIRKHMLGTKDS